MAVSLRGPGRRHLKSAAFLLLGAASRVPAAESGQRLSPPAAEALKAAEKKVRELFAQDYAARKAEEKKAFPRKLIKTAEETPSHTAVCFALLAEARDLAAEAGDATTAVLAIDRLEARYTIEPLAMKTASLPAAARKARSPPEVEAALRECLRAVDQALPRKALEPAGKLLAAAKATAGKLKNAWFDFHIEERERRRDRLAAWEKALERARRKLAEQPGDADANLLAGVALCLGLGDWESGLPFLARGGALAARIAKLEQADPRSPEERLALAEAWWDLAAPREAGPGGERSPGEHREAARDRAFFWYEQALPGLKGVARVELEIRLAEKSPRYLSELQELEARVGHGEFGKDGKVGPQAGDIEVHGLPSPHGLHLHGTPHGDSYVRYRLGGRYRKLEALVALNDSADRPWSAITFLVEGDGKLLWKSSAIKEARRPQSLSVEVAGVDELKLIVRCPGHHHMSHGVWLEPVVVR